MHHRTHLQVPNLEECDARLCDAHVSRHPKCVAYPCPVQRLGAAFVVGRVHNSHIPLDRRHMIGALSWLTNTRSSQRATPRFRSQHHESARVYFFTGELFSALILISIFIT
jgi:hypothetical protein